MKSGLPATNNAMSSLTVVAEFDCDFASRFGDIIAFGGRPCVWSGNDNLRGLVAAVVAIDAVHKMKAAKGTK